MAFRTGIETDKMTIVLHALACSHPILCGYSVRTEKILSHQRAFCSPFGITAPYLQYDKETDCIEGCTYLRSRPSLLSRSLSRVPVFKHLAFGSDYRRAIGKAIDRLQPDIVHGHNWHYNGYPAYQEASLRGIPFVYEMRGMWEETAVVKGRYKSGSVPYRFNKSRETFLARHAARVFAISNALKSDLVDRGVEEEKIVVVPNGIDETCVTVDEVDHLMGVHGLKNRLVVGYAGSVSEWESLELIVDLISRLAPRIPGVMGLIVGGGPRLSAIQDLARQKGVVENMVFTGAVKPSQMGTYYRLIDVFVLPRFEGREVALITPLKPYEAMEAGCVVVMADLPYSREIVKSGETGFLVTPNDSGALERVCDRLLRNPGERKVVAERAMQWVRENHSWAKVVANYRLPYQEVLEPRATRVGSTATLAVGKHS